MIDVIQILILGLALGGVYALMASGLTLIFGVMHVINIAHGAFLILAAFLTYSLWSGLGIDPLAAIAITTPAMPNCSRVVTTTPTTIAKITNAAIMSAERRRFWATWSYKEKA